MVEPLSVNDLDERLRSAPYPLTDMSTAFMGAAGAVLFPNSADPQAGDGQQTDTRNFRIEKELMDLMDDVSNISSLTFIGSSEEEDNPFLGANFANVNQAERNSYGRPVQRVQPMVRTPRVTRATVNPPLVPSCRSAFSVVKPEQRRAQKYTHTHLCKLITCLCPFHFTPIIGTILHILNKTSMVKLNFSLRNHLMGPYCR